MWNNKSTGDEDESWEVRAFKEDRNRVNLMGCTWPPPSYTCTFCLREFRSAQALGGHMNVHRRDRAKLHVAPAPGPASPSKHLIPNPNLEIGNGLCLIYTLPNPGGVLIPTCAGTMEQFHDSPSNSDQSIGIGCDINEISANEPCTEELDLELRLGPKSPPPAGRREAYVK